MSRFSGSGITLDRRGLLKLGSMALAHAAAPRLPIGQSAGTPRLPTGHPPEDNPDYLLRIAPVTVELDRSHILSTVGYNGAAPGPLLRLRAGRRVGIDVVNDTDTPELVHWHGLLIPPEVEVSASMRRYDRRALFLGAEIGRAHV